MAKLTIKEINNPISTYQKRFNKLPDSEFLLLDEDKLYLRVRSNQEPLWVFIFKFNKKQHKLYIRGQDVASIRKQADTYRAQLKEGINPAQKIADDLAAAELEQKRINARLNVRGLFDKWEAIDLKDYKNGSNDIKMGFERYVFPVIGDIPIEEVKKSHIMTIVDNIKLKGLTRTPRLIFSQVRQMFRFALERDYIDIDPTASIRKGKTFKPDNERDRVLNHEELVILFQKLPQAGLTKTTELALKICLSTSCRIGEVLNAKWQDISFEQSTWKIPAENSKNGEQHLILLSPFSLGLFKQLKNYSTSTVFCVPNRTDSAPVCNKTVGKQISDRQLADGRTPMVGRTKNSSALILPQGKWTTHDLRRTSATVMSMLGVSPEVIDKCQNHKDQNRIKRIYQRYDYHKEKQAAWLVLGEYLEKISKEANKNHDFPTCSDLLDDNRLGSSDVN